MNCLLVELVKQDFGISGRDRWWRSDIHSSLIVDTEKERFYFNARDIKGTAVDYLVQVRGMRREAAEEFVKNVKSVGVLDKVKSFGIQERYEKLIDIFYMSGKSNRDYWYNRGLSDSTIDRYRLGFYDGWYLIPIYDSGIFSNFQCRRDSPEKKIRLWYKDQDFRPVLYNSDILKFVKVAYITEGMVDCILMNQMGFPTVCTTSGAMSWNSSWIRYFSNVSLIYYLADNDKAGISAASSVAKGLGMGRVKILRFKDQKEKYDVVDFIRDGGDKSSLLDMIDKRSVYGFEAGNL
jgi:hypothetical protein